MVNMFVNFFKWFVYKEDIYITCIMYRAVGSASLLCDQIEFLDPRPQDQEIFLRFYNFIGFISWFLRKWGPVCENWSQGSGCMARFFLLAGPQPTGPNVVSRPLSPRSKHFLRYHDFIGFTSWFWENEVLCSCLWKLELGF